MQRRVRCRTRCRENLTPQAAGMRPGAIQNEARPPEDTGLSLNRETNGSIAIANYSSPRIQISQLVVISRLIGLTIRKLGAVHISAKLLLNTPKLRNDTISFRDQSLAPQVKRTLTLLLRYAN